MSDNVNKKPSASKTTKRVSANRSPLNTTKGTRAQSANKKTVAVAATAVATAGAIKIVKKISGKSFAIIVLFFIISLAVGAGVCYFIGKNDNFDVIGSTDQVLYLGETYKDEGVSIKEFGIDLSKNAVIETNLNQDKTGAFYADDVGVYYIKYSVKSLKFGIVYPTEKIRLITFIAPSEGETSDAG